MENRASITEHQLQDAQTDPYEPRHDGTSTAQWAKLYREYEANARALSNGRVGDPRLLRRQGELEARLGIGEVYVLVDAGLYTLLLPRSQSEAV